MRVPILAAASLLLIATAALAYEPVGPDFRISQVGTDGDAARGADNWPAVAYNPAANEYLVVWEADGLATDDEFEVFGQRVSATGTELGSDFRISHGSTGVAGFFGEAPDVAYNPVENEYLVVWSNAQAADVFGQRISAAGEQVGTDDFQISDAGSGFTQGPTVAYNPTANEYLVTWESNDISPVTLNDTEIFGQRLSETGTEVGPDDFRISNVGPEGTDLHRGSNSDAVYNPAENEYLVGWENEPFFETEIFGQRVSAVGTEVGSDFRISQVGTDGDENRDAFAPAIAYNPLANEYLVVWEADGLATDVEFEVFGQRLSAGAAEVGPSDFRISNVGADGDALRDAGSPALAYTPISNEYIATWSGDGLATNDEFEIFGQRVSAAGAEVGTDFRTSNVGTDGNDARDGERPAIAYNSVADEFLVAWSGDGLGTNEEFEIFGHRLALPLPSAPPAIAPAPLSGPTGQRAAAIKRCKKKFPKGPKRKRCIRKAKRLPV